MTLYLNDPQVDDPTWYDGVNHVLVTWDDTHVAAIFSDASVSSWGGGSVRMITSDPFTGDLTLGPKTTYYNNLPISQGGPGDREDTFATIDAQKVGNLLVAWHTDTGRLFTFTYDGTAFTKMTPQRVDWAVPGEATDKHYGARITPWTSDTMLLIRNYDVPFVVGADTQGHGLARFAKWNGSSWDFGAIAENLHVFGSNDYMDIARVLDGTTTTALTRIMVLTVHPPGDNPYFLDTNFYYATITGSYPNAPIITETSKRLGGMVAYFEFQWYSTPTFARVQFVVPVTTGTLTPLPGGRAPAVFDWAIMPVTVSGGVVTEGPLASVGPTDGWYDISLTETTDGHVWAYWTLPGTASNGSGGSVGVRDLTDPTATTTVINDSFDTGVYTSDSSRRTIAAAGTRVVVTWMTRNGRILPVAAYGPLSIPIPTIDPNLAAELKDLGQSWGGSPW